MWMALASLCILQVVLDYQNQKSIIFYLNTSSDKISGDLNMGSFQINVETPIEPTDSSIMLINRFNQL